MGEESYERGRRNIADLVEQHEKDLYRGNGLPGLTTRMKSVEDRVDKLEKFNDSRENRLDKKMNILITTVLGLLSALVLQHFKVF